VLLIAAGSIPLAGASATASAFELLLCSFPLSTFTLFGFLPFYKKKEASMVND